MKVKGYKHEFKVEIDELDFSFSEVFDGTAKLFADIGKALADYEERNAERLKKYDTESASKTNHESEKK